MGKIGNLVAAFYYSDRSEESRDYWGTGDSSLHSE
jgi:hypothetical protein